MAYDSSYNKSHKWCENLVRFGNILSCILICDSFNFCNTSCLDKNELRILPNCTRHFCILDMEFGTNNTIVYNMCGMF